MRELDPVYGGVASDAVQARIIAAFHLWREPMLASGRDGLGRRVRRIRDGLWTAVDEAAWLM